MQYSAAHNVCVYQTPTPERILACVRTAKQLNADHVAVPCEIREMQLMRAMGYEAHSPILNNYNWPIRPGKNGEKLSPFAHQRQMAAFLTLHPRCFNLSDIGTGKTLGTLWALEYLIKKGTIRKALILSPLSTIYRVWEDEIYANFLSRLKATVLYGDRETRKRLLNKDGQVFIINHDGLGVGSTRSGKGISIGELAATIRDAEDIDAIIVDEGSVYKDSGTVRYKVLRQAIAKKPYVWWLTGTPTPNEPTDAWSQARAVRLDYQESQNNFKERTMYRLTTFKWIPRKDSDKLVASVLQPAIRFSRDECLDLPECMIEDRDVELSPAQKKAYVDIKKNLMLQLDKGPINAVNEAALRLKVIQISCGAVYDEQHEVNKIDAAPRIKILREVIEQSSEKILIFAPLTSVLNLLYVDLRKDYTCEVINGNVSAGKRNEVFRDFQSAANPRIIVADPRTMAHGLTLTAASTIVWYAPTDQPEVYTQANGRINRPGQTKSMLVVRLAGTPVEREIYKRLDNKESMQGATLKLITET